LINFQPFQGEEHRSFHWTGGKPAAVLIHGFPGTPAELRPLGQALHQAGWTVSGPLLPGFGADLESLPRRQAWEWIEAVKQTVAELHSRHDPVILIGYSMGAALAVQAAASMAAVAKPPSGLVLLAPFQRLGSRWQQFVGFFMKPFLRQMRPFKKADFSDPKVREGLTNFFAGIDLEDPLTQQYVRELTVPVSLLEQIQRVGQTASRLAKEITVPALILQGIQDDVVDPQGTRKLLQRLPSPVQYAELVGGHDLLDPDRPTWPQVEQIVLNFANSFTAAAWPSNERKTSNEQRDPNSRSAECIPHSYDAETPDKHFYDQDDEDDQ
jgi:carboxylesterase